MYQRWGVYFYISINFRKKIIDNVILASNAGRVMYVGGFLTKGVKNDKKS